METKKSSSKQWLILGVVFILLLFVFAYVNRMPSVQISGPLQTLASAIFGAGGLLFLVIGIIKFVIEKSKK